MLANCVRKNRQQITPRATGNRRQYPCGLDRCLYRPPASVVTPACPGLASTRYSVRPVVRGQQNDVHVAVGGPASLTGTTP